MPNENSNFSGPRQISRRALLSTTVPAIGAVALPAAASADAAETPNQKAYRLHRELSDTLKEAFGGLFGAEVYPAQPGDDLWDGKFFDLAGSAEVDRQKSAALRYFAELDMMDAEERMGHFGQKLQQAMFDQRPGVWKRIAVHDDDGRPTLYALAWVRQL